jgi:flagellar FliL protein
MFPLEERIVNLADPGGYRYLRVSIVLEFLPETAEFYHLPPEKRQEEEKRFKQELMRQKPVIDDIVTYVLSSKTFAEVFTVEGKEQLKEELMEKLNASLGEGKYVGAVYFTDFVIQ